MFKKTGAMSTSKSITFYGLNYEVEIEKDKYRHTPIKVKWYNIPYVRFLIFSIIEIIFYIKFRQPLFDSRIAFIFPVTVITIVVIYTYLFSDPKRLRMNHGAEHKVLNAFLNHDLQHVKEYSRYSEGCGGNISSVFLLLIVLSPIVRIPFTITTIFFIIYDKIKIIRYIIFNTIGKVAQYFTTLEPTEEILENTKRGFESLILKEVEKMIMDEIEKIKTIKNEIDKQLDKQLDA